MTNMIASRSADWKEATSAASRTADWKEHYSSMDEAQKATSLNDVRRECGLPTDSSPTYKSVPPIVAETLATNLHTEEEDKRLLTKKDARILLEVRDMISFHLNREERLRRSNAITVIDPDQFQISPTSIESYIAKVLRGNDDGLHLSEIIERLEQIGWKTTSVHHKYAKVNSAIRRHYYMFDKVGKAKFRLRAAFEPRPIERTTAAHQSDPNKDKLITIKDIVVGVVQKFYAPPGLYPSVVYAILQRMGYNCSYSAVYKAMQDESKFVREGFVYALAGTNANKKSATKSKRA